MKNRNQLAVLAVICLCCTSAAVAQVPVSSGKVELSVPFGTADGQLAIVDDYLVFLNQDRPADSFALEQSNVVDATMQDEMVKLQTRVRVRDVNQFSFRLEDPMLRGAVVTWARSTSAVPPSTTSSNTGRTQREATSDEQGTIVGEYAVRHNHTFTGGCDGRLVVTETQVIFESVTDIDHSRRWDVSDIKEIKLPNPYDLEIKPFVGSDYDFDLVGGEGMSSGAYKSLTEHVTESRR